MYINRGTLLNLFMFLKRMYEFLNKHLYIVLIISTLASYTNTRFYKSFIWLVKMFVLANIIFGVGYIIYFSVAEHSFTLGLQFYQDLISNYFSHLTNFWNDLMNIDIEDNIIKNSFNNSSKDAINQIKEELNVTFKAGIKEGITEAVNEAMDRLEEIEADTRTNTIKNIAFVGGILFLSYFVFVLPNDATPELLSNYNWFNQSLIGLKANLLDLIFGNNRGGGGNAPSDLVRSTSDGTSVATVTPNTPITNNNSFSPLTVDSSTQTITNSVNSSTQTDINALSVSKNIKAVEVLKEILNNENQIVVFNGINEMVPTITD
jgi:hypothetical protein